MGKTTRRALPRTPADPALAVVVFAARALKARFAAAMDRYKTAHGDEAADWDAQYEALGEIVDAEPPLWRAGGFTSERAFFKSVLPEDAPRTIRTRIRVARHFDPADEAAFSIEKLAALLDYLETENGGALPRVKVHPARQTVLVAHGGGYRRVPFDHASREQIRAAIRRKRGRAAAAVHTDSPAVKRVRARLRSAGLGAVAVRERHEVLDFGGVPSAQVQDFGAALAKLGERSRRAR
jgi:hypothetical protein